MAQPHTDSLTRAYELLANTHANMARSSMDMGNSIAQNFNDIGKSALSYAQTQKDNDFRERTTEKEHELKQRGLTIQERESNARIQNLREQAKAQRSQNAIAELLLYATHNKDKNGNFSIKKDIKKGIEKMGKDENFIPSIGGQPVAQSPLSSTPNTHHLFSF